MDLFRTIVNGVCVYYTRMEEFRTIVNGSIHCVLFSCLSIYKSVAPSAFIRLFPLGYTSTIFIGSHPSEGRENSTKDLGKYLFVLSILASPSRAVRAACSRGFIQN